MDETPLSDVIGKYIKKSGLNDAQIVQRAGLPDETTISNWVNGYSKKPGDWRDLVRFANGLGLTEAETAEILEAANHPPIADLLKSVETDKDRSLLSRWNREIQQRLKSPFQAPRWDVRQLVGRHGEQAKIRNALLGGNRVCILQGMGGVGKSTLALHMAHKLRHYFPDGVLWAELKGEESLLPILRSFAEAYGRDVSQYPDLSSCSSIVRETLGNKRTLLILDNVQSDEEAKYLIPSTDFCSILITVRSRTILGEYQDGFVDVMPFSTEDSLALFASVMGKTRVENERSTLEKISGLLDGLPLALRVVGAILKSAKDDIMTTAEYYELLQDEQKRLKVLVEDSGDMGKNIEACFEVSYRTLLDPVKEMFLLLSVFPGATFSIEAIAAVAKLGIADTKRYMLRLVNLSLVEVSTPKELSPTPAAQPEIKGHLQRYRLHALIELFARQKLHGETIKQIDDKMLHRVLVDYFNETELRNLYFDLNVNYDALPGQGTENKARELITYLKRHGRFQELVRICMEQRSHSFSSIFSKSGDQSFVFYERAAQFFMELAAQNGRKNHLLLDLEWDNILGVLNWVCRHEHTDLLLKGLGGLTNVDLGVVGFVDAKGYWHEAENFLKAALQNPSIQEDSFLHALLLFKLGAFYLRLSELDAAGQRLQESLARLDAVPNSEAVILVRAYICNFMAQLMQDQDPQTALEWSQRGVNALQDLQSENARYEEGYLYIRHSTILGMTGKLPETVHAIEKGLVLLPSRATAARVSGLMNLGNIHYYSGNTEKAMFYWTEAARDAEVLGDNRRLAGIWQNMASEESFSGNFAQAADYYEKALNLYKQIGDIGGEGYIHSNLAIDYMLLGKDGLALTHIQIAIEQARKYKLSRVEAFALVNRARLQLYQEQVTTAYADLQEAIKICEKLEFNQLQAEVLRLQAELALHKHYLEDARLLVDKSLEIAVDTEEQGVIWRVKGNILSASGSFAEAVEAYTTSLNILADQEPFELAKTKLAFGEHHLRVEQPEMAKPLLEEALSTFEKLQTVREIARTKTLLEKITRV